MTDSLLNACEFDSMEISGEHSDTQLAAQDPDSDELVMLQAVSFIEDSESYRSIHHRVDKRALYVSHVYNSAPIRWSRSLVIIIVHLLAFLEYPSSLSWTSDLRTRTDRYQFPCGSLEIIEIVCLGALCVDVAVKIYLIGWYNTLRSKWILAYGVVLVISLLDWSVSLGLQCTERIRVRRYLRPFFILQNSYLMKKMVNCLRRTMPEVVSVLLLLALHIYMFTLFGMLLFPIEVSNSTTPISNATNVEGTEYFTTLFKSLLSLLVLLTTANNPDVTMPAYDRNRFYQIYFVIFLCVGLFCFMNMLTAVIYNQFRGYFLNSMQSSLFRRRVGIRATFELLSHRTETLHHESTIQTVRSHVETSILSLVIRRCKLNKAKQMAMLETLDSLPHTSLSLEQFKEVFSILDMELEKSTAVEIVVITSWRYIQWLQSVILHKFFSYVGNLVAITNVIFNFALIKLIAVELSTQFNDTFGSKHSMLGFINLIFIIYYLIEQSLKLWAMGVRIYFSSKANVFDGLITVALVIVEVFYLIEFGIPQLTKDGKDYVPSELADILWNVVRFINILITVRLLRIIPHIKTMSVVACTLIDLIRSMKSFAGILVAIYYVFAILGIELFSNTIKYDQQNATKQEFPCGSYQQLQYWANNFDDFAAALVVLWDIMIVNNWHIFLEVYASVTNRWSYLYFVVWWLLSVVIILNLFTALILENFIMKWDKSHVERDQSLRTPSFRASTLTLHDMFRDGLREPEDCEVMAEVSQQRFLHLR